MQGKTEYPFFDRMTGRSQMAAVSVNKCRANLDKIPGNVSAILFSHKRDRNNAVFINVDLNEAAFIGACKYRQYIIDDEVPYYDECESFSIVYQTRKEEIRYFELITDNSYLPAGKKKSGNQIRELAINKGNTKSSFYFHLGSVADSNAQLRVFIQEFPLDKPLLEKRPIVLTPSIMPGQGYAFFSIEDASADKLFSPIELDWKNMELAFYTDSRTSRKLPITKNYLEIHMERSFPPDIPPVCCRYKNDIPAGLSRCFLYLRLFHVSQALLIR